MIHLSGYSKIMRIYYTWLYFFIFTFESVSLCCFGCTGALCRPGCLCSQVLRLKVCTTWPGYFLFYVYMWVPECMSVHHVFTWYHRDQKSTLDLPGNWILCGYSSLDSIYFTGSVELGIVNFQFSSSLLTVWHVIFVSAGSAFKGWAISLALSHPTFFLPFLKMYILRTRLRSSNIIYKFSSFHPSIPPNPYLFLGYPQTGNLSVLACDAEVRVWHHAWQNFSLKWYHS